MRIAPVILVFLLLVSGCLDHNLEELEFLTVVTEPPAQTDVGTILFQGRIDGLNRQRADACGFVWSENEKAVRDLSPGLADITVSPPAGNGDISASFPMKQGQIIFYRAYARLGERLVYGETEPYSLDQIVVMSMGFASVVNDSAALTGRLVGVTAQNEPIRAFGHVFSTTNQMPAIGAAGCDTTNLGTTKVDMVFTSSLVVLPFNPTYYVRAYAIGENDIFYSQLVDTFRVRDGWKIGAPFQAYREGLGVGLNGWGYAGFGCNSVAECFQATQSNVFWQFDPSGNSGAGSWSNLAPFPTDIGLNRTNALSFVIPGLDTVYVIFGDFVPPAGGYLSTVDFWKYAIASNTWEKGEDIPFLSGLPAPFRTGATGFSVQGKAYVGTGATLALGGQPDQYRNDFWEYDPNTGGWRKVASLPLRISTFDSKVYQLGRYEASAFAVADTGYAGGGETFGGQQLRDFWKFIPPSSALDTGRWELAGFFPGLSRIGAVSFSIGNKAFYGTGYNTFSGYLSDWWEFDPSSVTWRARTEFPGEKRADALGFSVQGRGFLGTGRGVMLKSNGQGFDPDIYSNFWIYTPEN